jgi:RNA polymerase sigma-70 factor (ECF subfamily)
MEAYKFNRLLKNITSDKKATTEIYCEYFPKLILHLRRRFGKLISPEDMAQETFLSLMSQSEFGYVEHPTTWMYTVADNKALDRIRRFHPELPLEEYLPDRFDFEELIMKEDVKVLLNELDDVSAKIIYLHHWEGYSHKEIAEILQMSCANVRTKISRAYAVLKKNL